MRLILISDTHGKHHLTNVPDGDVLIHAGDITMDGRYPIEFKNFNDWILELPHKHKIVIAGNHDFYFEEVEPECQLALSTWNTGMHYLQDSSIVIDNIKFYGSPWTPRFFDWAFNVDRGNKIAQKWQSIPQDTDVLITHGPPFRILDFADDRHTGCHDLDIRIKEIKPQLHVFGHIHEGYGIQSINGITYANACICNRNYNAVNAPIIFDL